MGHTRTPYRVQPRWAALGTNSSLGDAGAAPLRRKTSRIFPAAANSDLGSGQCRECVNESCLLFSPYFKADIAYFASRNLARCVSLHAIFSPGREFDFFD